HFFPKFAQKATQIITVSEYSKNDIVQLYGIEPQKIHAIWNGASEKYHPLTTEQQQAVRLKYTQGAHYFLYVGSIHPRKNLKRLVEAFVRFKKQTQSPTKLVIVGAALWSNESFSSLIPTELQQEIVFTGHLALDELTQIMGAAKLLTYIPYFEGFGIPLVEAMKCGVPLLSGNLTSLPEVAGNAAEYCNPFDVDEITQKLVDLDQNTHRLTELSQLSLERASQFSWDKAAMEVARVLGL
ncbi:MAG TPA: glycosyltransferase family 1 protein, partial [Taishania sp.]|nr:glycosyltransferase family 1 protein [Taishania sp.]